MERHYGSPEIDLRHGPDTPLYTDDRQKLITDAGDEALNDRTLYTPGIFHENIVHRLPAILTFLRKNLTFIV